MQRSNLVTSPTLGVQIKAIGVSLFLSVRSHILKTTLQISPIFSEHVSVAVHGSVLRWRWCNMLCISGFVDDVMFHIMEGIGQNQRRCLCFVQFARWRHRVGVCWLRMHLV